jgi:hypothetical protein
VSAKKPAESLASPNCFPAEFQPANRDGFDGAAAYAHRASSPISRANLSDIGALFDHLVSAQQGRRRHIKAKRLRGLEVEYEFKACRLLYRQVGVSALECTRAARYAPFFL